MAFFDKLENFARNISEKTGEAIEAGKLNSKINSEKALAAEEWKKIGEYYYGIYVSGGEIDPAVLEFCESAKAHMDAAGEAQAEIERARAEKEAAARAAEEARLQSQQGGISCPNCGAAVAEGKNFCVECGTKIEQPTVNMTESVICVSCGAKILDGKKFCGECGAKVEIVEQKPKFCTSCGAEIPEGRKFCGECGTRTE